MRRLTGVIIGCGAIAREHLTALAGLDLVDVVAVCDLSPVKAEATAERFGIAKWYVSCDELLADLRPDLVHVTTPPASHFAIVKSCLSAGLNVICEKPITIDYSDFISLKQLALTNRCMLTETQQMRDHSSVRRIRQMLESGALGDLLELQICISLNIFGADSPYVDPNAPHFSAKLHGGVIGDFLPHIAYLTYMFTGPVIDFRTIWGKHVADSPLAADEFRCLIKGERAAAYVSFSGNAQPNAFLIRLGGTKMRVEANLYEPPRLTVKRRRPGNLAVTAMVDGIVESRDVLWGSLAGFWRKLAGTSSYDGLREFLARTYRAIGMDEPPPVPLEEIDAVARLLDSLTTMDHRL